MKIITDDGQEFAIETVKITEIGMSDILFVRSKRVLCKAEVANIKQGCRQIFGADVRCLVLDGDLDIEILRQKAKTIGYYGSATLTPGADKEQP